MAILDVPGKEWWTRSVSGTGRTSFKDVKVPVCREADSAAQIDKDENYRKSTKKNKKRNYLFGNHLSYTTL